MARTLRSAVASIDPLLALDQVRTMEDALSTVEAPRRFNTVLITAFALGSLVLALTGIYAVVALTVSLRGHEIAVRMALGAGRSGIVRLVLVYGLKLALLGCTVGLAAGVAGGILFAHLMPGFLFDVSATDPLVYAISVVFMLAIATLASALPAKRAASTDPMETLRSI
jgi:putative ABC transport system permease protein